MSKKILLLLIAIFLITSSAYAKDLFSYEDSLEDDNGPGDYVYPDNEAFLPGTYDLQTFRIVETATGYDFIIKMAKSITNKSKNPSGWELQVFDVYLNFGSGNHKYALAGRNVKIKEGWDKAILIVPSTDQVSVLQTAKEENKNVTDIPILKDNLSEDILIPDKVTVKGSTLTATLSKELLQNMSNLVALQAFAMEYSKISPEIEENIKSKTTFVNIVRKNNSEYDFGGGTDFGGSPNVIDILDDNYTLGKYKSERDVIEFPLVGLVPVNK